MRERKNLRVRRAAAVRGREISGHSKRGYSQELMDLVVQAAKSRDLPVFLAGFAARATEMLKAEWGGVGEILGSKVEMYSQGREFPGGEKECEWVVQNVTRKRPGLEVLPLRGTAKYCAFYPIYASDGELMGTLCLVRRKAEFTPAEDELLAVLGSHAALSMEKVRRFAQLGRSPVALVGEPMISLRHIAETGSALPCPFCRNTRETREEYIATSEGRTFLVSTSRTHGVTDEETRTIHVLKDITDRQEAERRYRELFDSIQEGLFFATPEGQFLDVND